MTANSPDIIDGTKEVLDKIDTHLDGIIEYLDIYTNLIQEEIDKASSDVQDIVDEQIEELSEKLTDKLEPIRTKIIDNLSGQFAIVKQKVEQYIQPISSFVTIDWTNGTITPNIPTNPADIASAVAGIVLMLVPNPAVQYVVKFTTEIFPKVVQVSNKILQVASYTVSVDVPDGITVPPLDVEIDPITLQDITGE